MKTRTRCVIGARHSGHRSGFVAHSMHKQMCAQPVKHSGGASWHATHSGSFGYGAGEAARDAWEAGGKALLEELHGERAAAGMVAAAAGART